MCDREEERVIPERVFYITDDTVTMSPAINTYGVFHGSGACMCTAVRFPHTVGGSHNTHVLLLFEVACGPKTRKMAPRRAVDLGVCTRIHTS